MAGKINGERLRRPRFTPAVLFASLDIYPSVIFAVPSPMIGITAKVAGFHELLDVLLPAKGGVAVILKAYFDASTRTEGRIFAIAGFAFRKL